MSATIQEECEDVFMPAGMARYRIETAAMRIRSHMRRYGTSPLLDDALRGLEGTANDVERLCQAYQRKMGYSYRRSQ